VCSFSLGVDGEVDEVLVVIGRDGADDFADGGLAGLGVGGDDLVAELDILDRLGLAVRARILVPGRKLCFLQLFPMPETASDARFFAASKADSARAIASFALVTLLEALNISIAQSTMSSTRPTTRLASLLPFSQCQGAPYFASSFPAMPPEKLPAMLRTVSPQAPMSPVEMQSSVALMPSSSLRILTRALPA
jgi:hypothetical protein